MVDKVVERSHEDKVLFAAGGITKGQLIDYYEKVAGPLLEHARARPLSFKRCPDGIDDCFFQKDSPDYYPDWLRTVAVEKADGWLDQVIAEDEHDLCYLANQACIEFHAPLARADGLHRPDQIVFDLDPASPDDFERVKKAAWLVRAHLEDCGYRSFVKTTGSSGLHVVVPIHPEHDFDVVRAWAQEQMDALAETHSEWLTTEWHKDKRGGRLFLDTARNAYGQTAVLAYSVRAIAGAPVATPIEWQELDDLASSRDYDIHSIPRRLGQRDDPWQGLTRHRQHFR